MSMFNFLNLSIFVAQRVFLPLMEIGVVRDSLDHSHLVDWVDAVTVDSLVMDYVMT
jgi:hypothetical protein